MEDTQTDRDDATNMNPDEVYQFFKEMSLEDLSVLVHQAVEALSGATSRSEAETAVIKMAPFFLNCTFHRLPEEEKAALRTCLDAAEERHGSLAQVLGLDDELNNQSGNALDSATPDMDVSDRGALLMKEISALCDDGDIPESTEDAAGLAKRICLIGNEEFESLSDLNKATIMGLSNLVEERFGSIEQLAAKALPF